MKHYKIAAIAGDGIGKEVMPPTLAILNEVAKLCGFQVTIEEHDFASADYWQAHGRMMPEDWACRLKRADAILFGAVGWPELVPDHVSLWESLVAIRRGFDLYANVRPVKLMPGVPCPLVGRVPGDVDFLIVRENTEGEYSSVGGRMYAGTEREIVLQETIMSRIGVDRIQRYAFELARKSGRSMVTSATKSNGISITMPYWDERFQLIASEYPDINSSKYHIDILAAHFVLNPDRFDVVVASNLFGDILSDLGPACTGTIGIAPSGNINPERRYPSLFEPVHGSAPDIAGQGIANPIGQIWSLSMMLEHLGEIEAAKRIMRAIEHSLSKPETRTRDLNGLATTRTSAEAIQRFLL